MMKLLFSIQLLVFAFSAVLGQEENNLPSTVKSAEAEYNRRITLEKINGVYIPKNLEDVFATLDNKVDGESKFKVKMLPEEKVDSVLLPRLGLWMTLNWSFYLLAKQGMENLKVAKGSCLWLAHLCMQVRIAWWQRFGKSTMLLPLC